MGVAGVSINMSMGIRIFLPTVRILGFSLSSSFCSTIASIVVLNYSASNCRMSPGLIV